VSPPLRIATRSSPLALYQAESVARRLRPAGREVRLLPVETAGDRRSGVPIREIGGQGIFVKEVSAAVLSGRAEIAVHSAKDLEAGAYDPRLVLGAFPERADPRDALVGRGLVELAPGAVIATSSARRRAELAHLRPDLRFVEVRGNIATRLAQVPLGGALVVAYAALERLGRAREASEVLSTEVMVPQVGQGAIAVECRADDEETAALLQGIDDSGVRDAVEAERAFLAAIGGGCDLPVAGHALDSGGGELALTGLLASFDGTVCLREEVRGPAGSPLGQELARRLLEERGGAALLATAPRAAGR